MVSRSNQNTEYPSIEGVVVEGSKKGRLLGFPTANIHLDRTDSFAVPKGVYASKIIYQNTVFMGMVNVGTKPTFGKNRLTVEVNLFNFNGELYGEKLKIIFIQKLRDEKKFPDIESLKTQLEQDKILSENILISIIDPDSHAK